MPNRMAQSFDERVAASLRVIEELARGHYALSAPASFEDDDVGRLERSLYELGRDLAGRERERAIDEQITRNINAGLLLEDVLERAYGELHAIIPYNRIGASLIDQDTATVTAIWAKTDQPDVQIQPGYTAPLAGSSLETILRTGRPRILNDLRTYLAVHPESRSTQMIVAEGIRSSLTCPLIANGAPVGFLFFSSIEPGTYAQAHIDLYLRVAAQLSVMVEKARLVTAITAQKAALERQRRQLEELCAVQAEYRQAMDRVTEAAAAVEAETFDPSCLQAIAVRSDALGTLARVFRRMAEQVYLRERRLKERLQELAIEIDQAKSARQVSEITETDFFRKLSDRAQQMRAKKSNHPAE